MSWCCLWSSLHRRRYNGKGEFGRAREKGKELPPSSLARGLAPQFTSPSLSNACHAGYLWSWILRLVSLGDHKIYKMPASSSFSVKKGLAQMLLYALEKGPTEKNDDTKNRQPWEIYCWAQRSCNMVESCYSFNIYAVLITKSLSPRACGRGPVDMAVNIYRCFWWWRYRNF